MDKTEEERKEEEKQKKGGELSQRRQPNRSLEPELLSSLLGDRRHDPPGLEPNRRTLTSRKSGTSTPATA